jgi:hypothetical protein
MVTTRDRPRPGPRPMVTAATGPRVGTNPAVWAARRVPASPRQAAAGPGQAAAADGPRPGRVRSDSDSGKNAAPQCGGRAVAGKRGIRCGCGRKDGQPSGFLPVTVTARGARARGTVTRTRTRTAGLGFSGCRVLHDDPSRGFTRLGYRVFTRYRVARHRNLPDHWHPSHHDDIRVSPVLVTVTVFKLSLINGIYH